MPTITGDGTDQWQQVQNALNAGGTINLLISGTVFHGRDLNVKANTTITGANFTSGRPVDGFQSLNDTGPASVDDMTDNWYIPKSVTLANDGCNVPGDSGLRAREHVTIDRVNNVTISNIFIRGTKASAGQSTRYNKPNGQQAFGPYLEAQCGLNITGGSNVTITNVDIDGVWGDFAGFNPGGSGTGSVNATDCLIDGGVWSTCGRHGLGANGLTRCTWRNTVADTFTHTGFHCENSSNTRTKISDILLEDLTFDDSADELIHVQCSAGFDNLTVNRIHAGGELRITALTRNFGGVTAPRLKNFRFDDCEWDGVAGEIAQFQNVDTVWVTNFVGDFDPRNQTFGFVQTINCTDVHATRALNPGVVNVTP